MSEQTSFQSQFTERQTYVPMSRRDIRRMKRMERKAKRRMARHAGGSMGWLAGLVLIVIGVIYLLQYSGMLVSFTNWWALFLLIPAIGSFSGAYGLYQHDGSRGSAAGPLIAGIFFLFLSAVFLFSFDFGKFWPALMILAGLVVLAGPMFSRRERIIRE